MLIIRTKYQLSHLAKKKWSKSLTHLEIRCRYRADEFIDVLDTIHENKIPGIKVNLIIFPF